MTETPEQAHQRGRDEVAAAIEAILWEHEGAAPPPTWVAEIRGALADMDGAVARIKAGARAEAEREGAAYHFSAFEVSPQTPSGEVVSDLPAAIVEQLIQFYGNPPGPLSPRLGEILERRPYQSVTSRFVSQGWRVGHDR